MKTLEYEINIEENGQEVTKDIRLILYDTAGQERFRSCTKSYFKRASGVILLYSIIDRNSFNNLKRKKSLNLNLYSYNNIIYL